MHVYICTHHTLSHVHTHHTHTCHTHIDTHSTYSTHTYTHTTQSHTYTDTIDICTYSTTQHTYTTHRPYTHSTYIHTTHRPYTHRGKTGGTGCFYSVSHCSWCLYLPRTVGMVFSVLSREQLKHIKLESVPVIATMTLDWGANI